MPADRVTLYIKGDRDIEVKKQEVTLGDILTNGVQRQSNAGAYKAAENS